MDVAREETATLRKKEEGLKMWCRCWMPEKTYLYKVMMVEKKQTKPRLGLGKKKNRGIAYRLP